MHNQCINKAVAQLSKCFLTYSSAIRLKSELYSGRWYSCKDLAISAKSLDDTPIAVANPKNCCTSSADFDVSHDAMHSPTLAGSTCRPSSPTTCQYFICFCMTIHLSPQACTSDLVDSALILSPLVWIRIITSL